MVEFTVKDAALAVGGTFHDGFGDVSISSVSTDSREICPGALFVPVKGEKFDGHGFIGAAFENGAAAALSENKTDFGLPVIFVEDTKKALRDLAEYYRKRFPVPAVAVTGSAGKTSTKDMIASVLGRRFLTLKTMGNFNNEIGLPRTVFMMNEETRAAVFEMGMNSFGEIHNLGKIIKPDIAVITNIGVAHIERLGSREGILKAKLEILDYLSEKGAVILNGDDGLLREAAKKIRKKVLLFGTEKPADVFGCDIKSMGLSGTSFTVKTREGSFPAKINAPGAHMVKNALAAAAAGIVLGLEPREITEGLCLFSPGKMRMSVLKTKSGATVINDAYNANPVSVKASLDVLAGETGRRIAVLGDMLELGEYGRAMHYEVGEYAARKGIDIIICIGELSAAAYEGALDAGGRDVRYYPAQEDFIKSGVGFIRSGDTVLIKASRGMGLEKTAEKIQEVEA